MSQTIYLSFHDSIHLDSANRFMMMCSQIIQQYHPSTLYVLLSSGGGAVDSGVTLYNYLRALPCTVVTHNIGSIDSIATAVFLAGEKRYATPNSVFLFHGVMWGFAQGANLTYSQMKEQLSRFDAAEKLFAGIIVERTCFEASAVRKLFRQGQSKDPIFAKSKGVVHEVCEVSVEPGAPMLTVPHEGT